MPKKILVGSRSIEKKLKLDSVKIKYINKIYTDLALSTKKRYICGITFIGTTLINSDTGWNKQEHPIGKSGKSANPQISYTLTLPMSLLGKFYFCTATLSQEENPLSFFNEVI